MWSVGQLAKATGLTVRTLHHYEAIGLLAPSERGENGYRQYDPADVDRLYRIVALRELGLPLKAIGAALEGGDLRAVMEQHLAHVEAELKRHRRLRQRLRALLAGDSADLPLTTLIEETVMHEQYYTQDQLDQLAQRREALGEEGMQKAQRDWADLIADAQAEMRAGTDPADPKMQAIADRWEAMIAQFTGGDPGIRKSLERIYEEKGPQKASRGMVDPELMEYVAKARAAR
jgi:DNA-binding transcriptional MerR regulator